MKNSLRREGIFLFYGGFCIDVKVATRPASAQLFFHSLSVSRQPLIVVHGEAAAF